MVKCIYILLILSTFIFAQFNGFKTFDNFVADSTVADTTITVSFQSTTDYGQDSVDVVISATNSSRIDSMILILNEADVQATYANADTIANVDGYVTTYTLAHGQTGNDAVRLAVAAISTSGDTTSLVHRTHTVSAYDETAPTLLTFTATGDASYPDSVEFDITGFFVGGDSIGITIQEDTSAFIVDWFAARDTTFRFEYDVDGTQGINFFCYSKDTIPNLSDHLTDNAVIVDGAGDETAPTLTGTVALTEDITGDYYAYKIDETSVDAADEDLAGFEVTVKNLENGDSTQFLIGDMVDTILTMTGLGSYGSDDSLIVRIRAYDEVPNYSTPLIDTLARRVSDYIVFLPSIGRHLVSGVDIRFDADSTGGVDDSTHKTLDADSSGLGGDSLKVGYTESLNDNYISIRIDSVGSKSDWTAWMWQPRLDSVTTFAMAGDGLGKDTLTINAEHFPIDVTGGKIGVKLGSISSDTTDYDTLKVFAVADTGDLQPLEYTWDIPQDTTAYGWLLTYNADNVWQEWSRRNRTSTTMDSTGAGGGGGGDAANAVYRPDGDIAHGDWANQDDGTSNMYTYLDDGTTQPTAPAESGVYAAYDARTLEVTVAEVSDGDVNSVDVWIYGYDKGNSAGVFQCSITDDGSNWETAQNIAIGDEWADREWVNISFTSLGWTNTSDFRLRLIRTGDGNFEEIRVWEAYCEVNP